MDKCMGRQKSCRRLVRLSRNHLKANTNNCREEDGGNVDETHDPFLGDDKLFAKRDAEMQQKLKRRDGSTMTLAQSKRANEMNKDLNAWEENRLFTSGVARARQVCFRLCWCAGTEVKIRKRLGEVTTMGARTCANMSALLDVSTDTRQFPQ